MFFVRFLPVLVSVFVSAGLWTLGAALIPAAGKGNAPYAALVCSEAVSDREIRERLENIGLRGLVSESGQWVLLDSFGSVERIALDEYDSRVLPFDPRNDGYAEKLRSLFVCNGKRSVYIPLDSAPVARPAELVKKLRSVLGDIDYSLNAGYPAAAARPAGFYFALFCLAAGVFFMARPLRLALGPDAVILIPLLPALAPLALGGAAGFALASLLAGCAVLLAGPCLQWFVFQRHQPLPPLYRLLPPLFLVCYVTLAYFSGLPLVFTLPVLVFFCGVLLFSLQEASMAAAGNADRSWGALLFKRLDPPRRRFTPVPILRRRSFTFAFSWAMVPFAAIGLVLACADMVMPVSGPGFSSPPSSGGVTEADYYAHYRFQSTFSVRSLHEPWTHGGMNVYEMNGGLPVQNGSMKMDASLDGAPPFPLADFVRFLNTEGRNENIVPLACAVLMPLFFILQGIIIPAFLRRTTNYSLIYTRR